MFLHKAFETHARSPASWALLTATRFSGRAAGRDPDTNVPLDILAALRPPPRGANHLWPMLRCPVAPHVTGISPWFKGKGHMPIAQQFNTTFWDECAIFSV
ncbi:hypothetical protein Mkiyose1665_54780 [Mycobacterium kiyosense]|uniref:Uncharacterized protein n=1 Tax=Mycobacterium kiyosense TaxID=2871094 RepID=A0A9P3QD73_9MYCO|nr:hypothetical protein IWGMT90018_11710 [Mycobacterium kiyosense]BDE12529.1 hypothetical protein MKCMC460_13890 [Mycobacterium sp. 20KCMC460]GLB85853.1 hypothetical protein SRL2020028_51090 [Mycobacterium kiyosense]GLB91017.1 hypothetical protein SRL2020130_38340 [Mycobacterium kiyosense]GLB96983.1 hypothetical protein SRL2020226_37590 [Mycobacterium kiyosense]